MQNDYQVVKLALVQSIAENHPINRRAVSEESLQCASTFLNDFDSVFTTNYDLLLYWASLYDDSFPFEDGFGREIDTDDHYCVFLPTGSSGKQIFFLHGALHIYTAEGEVRKRVWSNTQTPLMEQVREALDDRKYPLLVSEGDSLSKARRIEASSYLSHCQRRFENIQGNLFTYGFSFSQQDMHILDWLATNSGLQRLFVGIYGSPDSDINANLIGQAQGLVSRRRAVLGSARTGRRYKKVDLEVTFFQSETANVWTPPQEEPGS